MTSTGRVSNLPQVYFHINYKKQKSQNKQFYRNNDWAISIYELNFFQFFVVAKFTECHEMDKTSLTAKDRV